ncbi:MAG: trypsin-like peptidase domain-containing protein [Planctomycetes bacterium]|nr:trypsin-like peptidase domain-containing protein [Planctomycetota bacterium]
MKVVAKSTRRLALLMAAVFSIAWLAPTGSRPAMAAETAAEAVTPQDLARIDAISAAFRAVIKGVKPTVVQIELTKEQKQPRRQRIDPEDLPEPFRDLFRDFGGMMPRNPTPQQGLGSGVVIDAEEGYILTNNHVVGGSREEVEGKDEKEDSEGVRLDVTLGGGRRVEATIVGRDPKTDVALIKIKDSHLDLLKKESYKLQAAKLGDSTKMDVGDWVLAIGAPFGWAETVTQGIISAKGRSNVGVAGIEDFIQTDAAINPGNSGGPLVNMHGEVIGINTAIATSGLARGYMGVGFSIPTEIIKQILPDLKAGRAIVRGYLGVAISGLEQKPGLAQTFGLTEDRGVVVEEVGPDTPAEKAGLKPDDVILAIGDTKIESVPQLQGLVARTEPGETIRLAVWRDGKRIAIPVKIEAQPGDFYAARNWLRGGRGRDGGGGDNDEAGTKIESVGMTVAKATPELARKYGWDPDEVEGQLIVTEVEPLGEAGSLRISEGDIILSVQGEPMKSTSGLKKALSPEALEKGVRLQVRSELTTRTIPLRVTP